jgi:tetratricopeptide (TPR) repeat protein
MKSKVLILMGVLSFQYAFSQVPSLTSTGWNWPQDPQDRKTAEEKYVLYTDMFNLGNFKAAEVPFLWLLEKCPDLNPSLYINGAKIFENLADAETNAGQKKIYADSCLMLYDLRIKYFDEEANVLNRKAFYAYKFKYDDTSYYPQLFELFQKAFKLNKGDFLDNNLVAYMDVVRRYKQAGGKLTDDQILDIYDTLSDVIDYKIQKATKMGKNVDYLNTSLDQINQLLPTIINVSCEFIDSNLLPKMLQNPNDLKMAKNVFKLAYAQKCFDGKAFLQSAIIVQKNDPQFGMAKLIGDRYYSQEDFKNAILYYDQALDETDENTKKADIYLKEADIYSRQGEKQTARDQAEKCIKVDPSKNECYTTIGNLYFNSFNECKQEVNPVQDRAVYIAAYEMYRKAGNKEGMANAKAQFPSNEDIFTYNMHVGDPIKVGCWINEVVTIQKRE